MQQNKKDKQIEQQFLEAYDELADALYRHCYFRVYSQARADELVQDTFMKTWEYLHKGKKVDNLKAFLYRVANNLIIDYSRKKQESSLEALIEAVPAAEPSYDGNAEHHKNVLLSQIRAAMDGLPEEMRTLLTMRYIDDMDPKEIGLILNMSANNVSVKLNRAAKHLQSIIEA